MVSLWITIGLLIATVCVGSIGAFFSITGLGALFSGALLEVWIMAGSLEFAKFMLAAYLHQTWKYHNFVYKSYLTFAVAVLSAITSIGIYGFLTDAYQSASAVYESETIKTESIKSQQSIITSELARLNKLVDEIPENRVTKRLKMRAELEPQIQDLNKKYSDGERLLTQSNLRLLEVKKKVGPLIHIAKSMNISIDKVVNYLVLILVSVFDPLAICLVIASTHSISSFRTAAKAARKPEDDEVVPVNSGKEASSKSEAAAEEPDDVIVQMNFKDESEDEKAV